MMHLPNSPAPSPLLHTVPTDPGTAWSRDEPVAVDTPPDDQVDPAPDGRWPAEARRTGIYGAVSPRIVALAQGGYRLYYTQILPRPGFPAGANDYDNATTRILSAYSPDGVAWQPEPGVRLTPQAGGGGEFRVVSSEVVPLADGRLRMYYEACPGPQSGTSTIRSALSAGDGLLWIPEPGIRLGDAASGFSCPRFLFLEDGRCRLYCHERGKGIVSATSEDGGFTFQLDAGVRIAGDGPYDAHVAFAPEIVRIAGAGYRIYYAGYGRPNRAYILTARSADGLSWQKETEPVLAPSQGRWDAAKCSEMCILRLPTAAGAAPRYRMLYEACDGTAAGERGVWRVASATSAA